MGDVTTITVPLGDRSYPVHVGCGARSRLAHLVAASVRRVAVVTQAGIPFGDEDVVGPLLAPLGVAVTRIEIGTGESQKSLTTVEHLAGAFAAAGLTRTDVVVAVGGGMVTDVAGFAAAVWHRGIPVIHVATTLLGMVDVAIGGKTGVNTREGKNLVGAFWQPSGVICDLDALDTLPPRERRSGDGEMAKYHFLSGEDLDAMPLAQRVARCVQIKAEVVASDEREAPGLGSAQKAGLGSAQKAGLGGAQKAGLGGAQRAGRRALLNYGHTLAHALEIATDHDLTHGESVGIGLVYAAELAHGLSRIDAERVEQHRAVVGGTYGLPLTVPAGLDPGELMALMARDKKALDGLTFVLDGPRGVEVVAGVDPGAARSALARVS